MLQFVIFGSQRHLKKKEHRTINRICLNQRKTGPLLTSCRLPKKSSQKQQSIPNSCLLNKKKQNCLTFFKAFIQYHCFDLLIVITACMWQCHTLLFFLTYWFYILSLYNIIDGAYKVCIYSRFHVVYSLTLARP